MDFWSRFVGSKSPKKPTNPNSPQQRLAYFKRAYQNLLKIWNNGSGVSKDAFVAENIRICLRRLAELLNDDQRGPTPHLCISFAATSRILVLITRVAAAFCEESITQETLGICSLLIDNEEEPFLEDRGFADALPQFINAIRKSEPSIVNAETESSMVEILFGVASKLRHEPLILKAWFRPEDLEPPPEDDDIPRKTRSEEFPLFYLLLHYVPTEGRAGEFAQMGLLYVVESISNSQALEKWVVEGDMAAMMASGLGALYGQLSRNLALSYNPGEMPLVLTFSERQTAKHVSGPETTNSPEYQAHLSTFLSSLVFWQDLLNHCTSDDVSQTLLDHFKFLFLQQLLYPSLLESSDIDGGSAVAVLTYLRHIFETIDHPDLVRLTVSYLFGQGEQPADSVTSPITQARRRKSDHLLASMAATDEQPSPAFFNLGDLILASLRSKSQETAGATLQLLSAMIRRQHQDVLARLIKTRPVYPSQVNRTIGGQEKEVDNFLALAESLTGFQDLEASYDKHLYDNRLLLETHPCARMILSLPGADFGVMTTLQHKILSSSYSLVVDDALFKSLLRLLDSFLENDIETNLALTQVIVDLATCNNMRLEGWLLTEPAKYIFHKQEAQDEMSTPAAGQESGVDGAGDTNENHDQNRNEIKLQLARREPAWEKDDSSIIFKSIDKLVCKVEAFNREITDFEMHLHECRNALESAEAAGRASPYLRATPRESGRSSPNRLNDGTQIGSISERLHLPKSHGTESRSGSPRGRQLDVPSTPTMGARTGQLRMSPPRGMSESPSKAYSSSPLRNPPLFSLSATPPRIARSVTAPPIGLQKKIRMPSIDADSVLEQDDKDSDASSTQSEETEPNAEPKDPEGPEITLGHLLTNVIILQEFILEIAALVEVRASLFGEVVYS